MNPIVEFLYFAAVAGVSMFCMNPVILILSALGAVSFFAVRNCGKGKKHGAYIALALAVFAINPLFQHNGATVLFVLNGNPVTLEALLYGASAGIMLLATLYWFRNVSEIMTSDKILYIFGRVSAKLALILSMAMRYIPLFSAQMKRTAEAQKALGLAGGESVPDRVRGGAQVFSAMITWALENGITTADSMEARGYGVGRRSSFAIFRFHKSDAAALGAIALLFGLTLGGMLTNLLSFSYYPYIEMHEMTALSWLCYIAYALLSFLPTLKYTGEKIKWKYLQSKI